MNNTKNARNVTWLLGIGIALVPYIFCWLTLRNGYSKQARIIAFIWMASLLAIVSSTDFQKFKNQSVQLAGGMLKERSSRCYVPVIDKKMVEFADTKIPDQLSISGNEVCDMTKAYMAFHEAQSLSSMKKFCLNSEDLAVVTKLASQGDQQAASLAQLHDGFCTTAGQSKQLADERKKIDFKVYSVGAVSVGANSCPAILVSTTGQLKAGNSLVYQLFATGMCADVINGEKGLPFAPTNYPGLKVTSHKYSGQLPTSYVFHGVTYPFMPPPNSNVQSEPTPSPIGSVASVASTKSQESTSEVMPDSSQLRQVTDALNSKDETSTPSFDCNRASTTAEQLVCADRQLAAADIKLAKAYKYQMDVGTAEVKANLKKQQNEWRKHERDICTDTACVLKAYQKRLEELQD
jgi:uncharacterized protein YecT (DUF1311 family)